VLQVTKIYARSFDLDHIDVFWEIGNFVGNIRQFDFYLYRSESSFGPWDLIAGPFQDQYYFRDVTTPQKHKLRSLFYLLKIVDKTTEEEKEFGPTSQQGESDLIALEINRQEDLLFREFVGRRCWVFPVRTFGAYCICYDKAMATRTKAGCLQCYDAGFLGGFLAPIECFIQFDPSSASETATPLGAQQSNQTSARLIAFPQIKPKDVVIEAENKRWRVGSVTTTQRLRAVVHQELVLKEIPRGDVEYKLPVNIADLKALNISSERNFTNPQHTDGVSKFEDILAVYGYMPRGTVR
jgi:hypothetical protein